MEKNKQQICMIKLVFPTASDEQAIDCKKKIQIALSEVPDVAIDFRLLNAPPKSTE